MKHLKLASLSLLALSLAYCKSKQKTVEAAPVQAATTTTPATKTPGDIQKEIVEARWPGTLEEELKEGQTIYTTKCTRCHKAYDITEFGEKKWLHEIDDMSPKAKLTPEEKLKLTKYVLSYRETKERMKGM